MSQRFRKVQHLRKTADFARVYARRCVVRGKYLTVFGLSNSTGTLRLGLSVSKKHGNAVARNRLKRLIREAFRLAAAELPAGYDVVVAPNAAAEATLPELQAALCDSVARLVRRLQREAPAASPTTAPEPST